MSGVSSFYDIVFVTDGRLLTNFIPVSQSFYEDSENCIMFE